MKFFTKLTIWTLTIIAFFCSSFLAIPQKAIADVVTDPEAGDYIPLISYQQTAEQKYISDYLLSKGINNFEIENIISYLDKKSYFTMTPAKKVAFLQQGFRERKLYFWKNLPLVIQVERANGWANGDQYKTVDMSYKTCYGDNVTQKINDAMKLFASTYCQANIAGAKNNFFDKQKWQSATLDNLYYAFWPDLANFRYRTTFNDQEITRLNAFYSRAGTLNINCKSGYVPPTTKTEALSLLDMVMMITFPEELALTKGAEITVGGKKILSEIANGKSMGVGPSPSGKITLDTNLVNTIFKRWKNSRLPVEYWATAEEEFRNLIRGAAQRGKLIKLSDQQLEEILSNIEFSSSLGDDVGGLAPNVSGGRITSPMIFNSNTYKPDVLIRDIKTQQEFMESVAHEINHYLFYVGGGSNFYDPVVAKAYMNLGFPDSGAGPLNEVITDYLAKYNNGLIAQPGQYGSIGWPKQYYDTVRLIVSRIETIKGLSYSQSVEYLFDSYSNGKLFDLFKEIYPQDPDGGMQIYSKINQFLAEGNYRQISNLLR